MSTAAETFAERQAQLRGKFVRRTQEEADTLLALVAKLDTPEGAEAQAGIHHIVHRLAGGAGVFGLDELTQPAIQVEDLIDASAVSDAVAQATTALVKHIRLATARSLAAAGPQP